MKIDIQPCAWLYGEPVSQAVLKHSPEDFIVQEDLGYEPSGEGEHHYLYIRKRGENTDWVARQLANFCQVSPRDVAYAGKKDRHAVTEQWFSVQLPANRRTLNWALFGGDSIQVLSTSRHKRKIKLGNLRGNRFKIRLRQVTDRAQFAARLQQLAQGVPNYFGEQRFGREFSNLYNGIALLNGELEERQRHKRGLYISAVRSYLFNQLVSQRIRQQCFVDPICGDVLIEPYTQRCQHWEANPDQQAALNAMQLHISAPLWGAGELYSRDAARDFESAEMALYADLTTRLADLGLRQERRSIRLVPEKLAVTEEADGQWLLEFSLPSGCFATSVLRELCRWGGVVEE